MLKIKKIMGRKLSFVNGYTRVQFEMDEILTKNNDIKISYDYYNQPKNIFSHFYKRLIKYPRHLKKTDNKNVLNHIIVQHLSDLARKLNPDMTIIHLLDIYNFIKHKGLKNSSIINRMRLKGLKKCKHIISISEFSKNEAINKLRIDENRITVIRCGVNRKKFYPVNINDNIRELNILHVGTESGRKDFLTLLYAFKEVKKYITNSVLVRVGKPEYMNEIKKLGLKNDIIYYSKITDHRLNMLYNFADVFVFPSTYEGYGLPIMESLSCGTPVICSDIPVFREIYKDNVRYFPVGNYLSLTTKILGLRKKSKLIEKGLKLAENNTWEKYAKQYLRYINSRFS